MMEYGTRGNVSVEDASNRKVKLCIDKNTRTTNGKMLMFLFVGRRRARTMAMRQLRLTRPVWLVWLRLEPVFIIITTTIIILLCCCCCKDC
jgi:hypothetical protein